VNPVEATLGHVSLGNLAGRIEEAVSMRRATALAAIVAAVALTTAGCTTTSTPAPTPVRSTDLTSSDGGFDEHAVVGVLLRDGTDADALSHALTDAGYRPDVRTASGTAGHAAAAQVTAMRALVRTGAKVLVVDAVDPSALDGAIRFAHDAGVVVVSSGSALPGSTSGDGSNGTASDYAVRTTGDADAVVARTVRVVDSLQRGEKPASGDVSG
jgi:ABC-type sugar transport system substrate-binding protein